jgi:flagellar basal-body rod modification protein FlgD
MTAIDPVYKSTSTDTGYTNNSMAGLGKEDFLRLLLAQLEYQDPLEPIKNEEFVAQLTQFSSLEQLFKVNENLSYLQMYAASQNNSQAINFIGKEIKALGNTLYINNEGSSDPATVYYKLTEDAENVTIAIYNAKDELVRTIERGSQEAGEYEYMWDGRDDKGKAVPEGEYTYKVTATTGEDEDIKVNTFVVGRVSGLFFEDGITYLLIDKRKVALGSIVKIS